MPKYTITIADIDLNIHTEESPEMVETLVSTVDSSFRSIAAMSPRLSKSETAVLCAVDYCAAKIRGEARTKELEAELERVSAELDKLRMEYDTLASQAEEVRRENRVMNDIISKNLGAAATAAIKAPATAPQGEQLTIETDAEAEPAAETVIPATEVMFDTEDDDNATAPAVVEETPKKKPRRTPRAKSSSSPRNKVGDMFDMLTFKDV